MIRLDSLSRPLVKALRGASEDRQRAASLTACEFAVRESGLQNNLIESALATLRASRPISAMQRRQLAELSTKLDNDYLTIQELVEKGRATEEECLRAFGQARAAMAVSFAMGDKAFEAAAEGIYEAAMTRDTPEELVNTILRLIHS